LLDSNPSEDLSKKTGVELLSHAEAVGVDMAALNNEIIGRILEKAPVRAPHEANSPSARKDVDTSPASKKTKLSSATPDREEESPQPEEEDVELSGLKESSSPDLKRTSNSPNPKKKESSSPDPKLRAWKGSPKTDVEGLSPNRSPKQPRAPAPKEEKKSPAASQAIASQLPRSRELSQSDPPSQSCVPSCTSLDPHAKSEHS